MLHLLVKEANAIGKLAYYGAQIWKVAIIQPHDRPELARFVERAQAQALAYLAIGQRARIVDVGSAIEVKKVTGVAVPIERPLSLSQESIGGSYLRGS